MATVQIGMRNAARVGGVLREIGAGRSVPPDVQANVAYWASVVHRTMDRQAVRSVARLLGDVAMGDFLPPKSRRAARHWASYLEAQL
jgi:uncharacterized protein (DUF2236 family)